MPSLNFAMQFQQHLNWCWAATTVAVDHYYTPASVLDQCTLVNQRLGRGDCCAFQLPWHACNSTGSASGALAHVGHLALHVAAPAPFAQVQTEIDNLRPFIIRVAWWLGGAHVMTCSGYYQTVVGSFLLIKDPTFGISLVPFAVFPTMYWGSLGAWTDTSYTH
jgi:hypothetical protein